MEKQLKELLEKNKKEELGREEEGSGLMGGLGGRLMIGGPA